MSKGSGRRLLSVRGRMSNQQVLSQTESKAPPVGLPNAPRERRWGAGMSSEPPAGVRPEHPHRKIILAGLGTVAPVICLLQSYAFGAYSLAVRRATRQGRWGGVAFASVITVLVAEAIRANIGGRRSAVDVAFGLLNRLYTKAKAALMKGWILCHRDRRLNQVSLR